jgi:hypothetical protein
VIPSGCCGVIKNCVLVILLELKFQAESCVSECAGKFQDVKILSQNGATVAFRVREWSSQSRTISGDVVEILYR